MHLLTTNDTIRTHRTNPENIFFIENCEILMVAGLHEKLILERVLIHLAIVGLLFWTWFHPMQ